MDKLGGYRLYKNYPLDQRYTGLSIYVGYKVLKPRFGAYHGEFDKCSELKVFLDYVEDLNFMKLSIAS